jgi:glutamate-1-semialdehyde aminotransferase
MDFYCSALYTGAFQEHNFGWRSGLDFIRLVTATEGVYDRLNEHGPMLHQGFRQ